MARTGRSYPSHQVIIHGAGLSNYFVTLSIQSPALPFVVKQAGKTLSVVSAIIPTLTPIKLKALQTLSVVTTTVPLIIPILGKGMILSVVSPVTVTVLKGPGKILAVSTSVIPTMRKGIGKFLGDTISGTLNVVFRSKIVVNNFDGGLVGPVTTPTVRVSPLVQIFPGLFRIAPPKGAIKVQFRTFIMKIVKRVVIP